MAETSSATRRVARKLLISLDENTSEGTITSQELESTTSQTSETVSIEGDEEGKRGRKRKRDPSKWIRNIRKQQRLQGREYKQTNNSIRPAVTEGPRCNCRRKCFVVIPSDVREKFRSEFYNLQDYTSQRMFLGNFISKSETKRPSKIIISSRRKNTFTYSIPSEGGNNIVVCKQALISIFGLSASRLEYLCDKIAQHGTPPQDQRGKHKNRPNRIPQEKINEVKDFISSIPKYRSHYTRRHNPHREYLSPLLSTEKLYQMYVDKMVQNAVEPIKAKMFRHIFVTSFNLHFGHPSLDACNVCDQLEVIIQDKTEDEKKKAEDEKALHLLAADLARKQMQNDKMEPSSHYLSFDLQQTLPTPHLHTNVVFYSRQLWTYNLGIRDCKNSIMAMWSEDEAGRGSSEIISCLNAYFQYVKPEKKSLIVWSDSCGGQNKNRGMLSYWYYLVHKRKMFSDIVHKFPVPGHSFLDNDRDFGVIENKKRKVPFVYDPEGWYKLVESARPKAPFTVLRMKDIGFVSVAEIQNKLVFHNVNIKGEKVKFQKAARFRIHEDNPGSYFVAYTHELSEEWQEVSLKRRGKVISPGSLIPAMKDRRISSAKLADLKSLMKFIPERYRRFYNNLQAASTPVKTLRDGKLAKTKNIVMSDVEECSDSDVE